MNIRQALRATEKSKIAFVGSGGKTTAIFQLARLMEQPVLITTSTHFGKWQVSLADRHFIVKRPEDFDRYIEQIDGVTLFTGSDIENDRIEGLSYQSLEKINLLSERLNVPLLVEADGSRQKPLKAPADHEPEIPTWVNHVVVMVGILGLGKPLMAETVHRVENYSRLSGIKIGEEVTIPGLFEVLNHPEGGLKNLPRNAKVSAVLNQVDSEQNLELIMRIANIPKMTFNSITICTLKQNKVWYNIEPCAGIILAAGEAARYGSPKLLLEWRGKPIIRHVAENALKAGLRSVIAVVGAGEQSIRNALVDLPVKIISNPNWQQGQSASIRKGLLAVEQFTGSAIFLLADQPIISSRLISALIEKHQRTQSPIIAPISNGKRGNPVLFDQVTFPDLLEIKGDIGGRAIFGKYHMETIEWNEPDVFLDIDTPDDYKRLQEIE